MVDMVMYGDNMAIGGNMAIHTVVTFFELHHPKKKTYTDVVLRVTEVSSLEL